MPETFTPITWRNDQTPALDDINLNRIEVGVETLDARITDHDLGRMVPIVVDFATSIVIDATRGSVFRCVATADITLDSIVGGADGQLINVQIKASGGSRTLSFTGSELPVVISAGKWWWGRFLYVGPPDDQWLMAD